MVCDVSLPKDAILTSTDLTLVWHGMRAIYNFYGPMKMGDFRTKSGMHTIWRQRGCIIYEFITSLVWSGQSGGSATGNSSFEWSNPFVVDAMI